MAFSAETYGVLSPRINSIATGFKSATANDNGSYTVEFVDGTTITTTPIGSSSVNQQLKNVFPSYWEQLTPKRIDEGVYLKSSGVYGTKDNNKVYVYDVEPNKYYWYLGIQGISQAMCSYASDGTLIDHINDNPGNKSYLTIKGGIYKTPSNCTTIKVCYYSTNQSQYNDIGIGNLFVSNGFISNDSILTNKKWAVCGDSYTAGDWSANNPSKADPSGNPTVDVRYGTYKTYPYNISDRTNIQIVKCAKGGIDFTNASGAVQPFSSDTVTTGFYVPNYSLIPTDVDYITLQFGLNETDVALGQKGDTTNETLWGAYDVVIKWIKLNIPKAKLGIIISDAWLPKTYHDELIEIAKYYTVPYLDLSCYDNAQPNGCYTRQSYAVGYIDATINQYNRDTWLVSEENNHPNLASHIARSYVVENFLKSL